MIADAKSPLVYGYNRTEVPVYFSQSPVLNAGAGAHGSRRERAGGSWRPRRRQH